MISQVGFIKFIKIFIHFHYYIYKDIKNYVRKNETVCIFVPTAFEFDM